MAYNLYVSGLPASVSHNDFKSLFEPFGRIVSCTVTPHKPGSQTAYGFVRYATMEECNKCISVMNNFELNGFKINVKVANDGAKGGGAPIAAGGANASAHTIQAAAAAAAEASAAANNGQVDWDDVLERMSAAGVGIGRGAKAASVASAAVAAYQSQTNLAMSNTNVYVACIADIVDEGSFRKLFEAFGTILSIRLVTGSKSPNKYGFVRFGTVDQANYAIASMNNFEVGGSKLQVRQAKEAAAGEAGDGALPFQAAPLGISTGFSSTPPPPDGDEGQLSQSLLAMAASQAASIEAFQGKGSRGGGGSPPGGGGDDAWLWSDASDNLYIKGLPPGIDDRRMKLMFTKYGDVASVKVLEASGMHGDSIALMRMGHVEQAKWIVENLNGTTPDGMTKPLIIRYADTPDTKSKRQAKGAGKAAQFAAAAAAAASASGGDLSAAIDQASAVLMGGRDRASSLRSAPYPHPKHTGPPYGGPKALEFMRAVGETVSGVKAFPDATRPDGTDPAHLYVAGMPPTANDLFLYHVFAPFGGIRSVNMSRDEGGYCKGWGWVRFGLPSDADLAILTLSGNPLPDGSILNVSVAKPQQPKGAPVPRT
mmetsp:Transcript_57647/g.187287  ORF Transcript_57647/g.187287 Transcript_57647/m.187287 type:complete len:596 (+) Transcript_57647:171-1958(+)